MATHYRTCPFCEATCGLEIEIEGSEVVSVRGDEDDVFSRGFICPKAYGVKQLHEDEDRLTTPLIRRDGELVAASWDEAFEEIDRRLAPLIEEHGKNAVGVYIGNPNAHNLSALIHGPAWLRVLGSQNLYSASTVDQMPKQVSAGLMFGAMLSIPIPDVDNCDHLILLGANPLVSNGSLLTAPDMRGRLRGIRERGGKVVVVDPRRTRTAEEADEHHFIQPGSDALLLAAMACTIVEEGLDSPGSLSEHLNGLEEIRMLVRDFTPEAVAGACGIDADEIRRMARELAAAERGCVYARIGTCTQEFGTHASWLVDVLNVLTGNLDREGGAMFTRAAAGQKNSSWGGAGRGVSLGRWTSRVRGLPEVFGELPVSVLAEEIETPGEGQVRALITVAGNPLLSTPNSDRLEAAVEGLDFMLSIDIYVNETTRHADVVLPAPEPLEKAHYDLAFYQLSTRNIANYSPAIFEGHGPAEWEVYMRLAGVIAGQGPNADIALFDDMVIQTLIQREVGNEASPIAGRDPAELLEALDAATGPGARARLHAALRSLRRRLRARSRGSHARPARAEPARHRPGAVEAATAGGAAHGVGKGRAGAGADHRGPRPPARGHRPRAGRRDGADRTPPVALEQLVDAQPSGSGEGQGALHPPHPSRRCGAARARQRRAGADQLGSRLGRGPGRDHRGHHARRGLDPARLGPRRSGGPYGRGVVTRRREQQRAGGRVDDRSAVRERRPQRDPGRGERAKWR